MVSLLIKNLPRLAGDVTMTGAPKLVGHATGAGVTLEL
jgi:hypothetical protein